MMDRQSLIDSLQTYTTTFQDERAFVAGFLQLLEHPSCFNRDHLPGHITGSSWILNKDITRVLLVNHAKLNKWLQPGGHANGEEDVLSVALREAKEETGMHDMEIVSPAFFDIDIHSIPERKDFPRHDHYDLRFLFIANEHKALQISEESTDVRWVGLPELKLHNIDASMMRMNDKATLMLSAGYRKQ